MEKVIFTVVKHKSVRIIDKPVYRGIVRLQAITHGTRFYWYIAGTDKSSSGTQAY
ncbi:hypothetical protein BN440_2238 [Erwinia amylovora MR1]|nr:hypothetical protein BN440_2238 [Erwinia amylovora MR1]